MKKYFYFLIILSAILFAYSAHASVYVVRDWSQPFEQGTFSSVSWSTTSTANYACSSSNSCTYETTSTLDKATSTEIEILVGITSGLSSDAVSGVSCSGGASFNRIGHGQTSGNRWESTWGVHLNSTSTCPTITITNSSSEFTGATYAIYGHTTGIGTTDSFSGVNSAVSSTMTSATLGSNYTIINQWYPTPAPYGGAFDGSTFGATNSSVAGAYTGNFVVADSGFLRDRQNISIGSHTIEATQSASQPYSGQAVVLEDGVGNLPPPPNAPSVAFLYPQSSTSTFIHDFTDFTFVATNTNAYTQTWRFSITFDTTSTLDQNPITLSRNVDYVFSANATHYLSIPKPQILASSTQYWAEICYTLSGNPILNCGNSITFKIGATIAGQQIDTSQAGFFGASSTEASILYQNVLPPVSNGSEYCDVNFYNPASWACWAFLQVKSGIDQLGEYAGAGMTRIASTTEDIFPMNILFAFNGDIQSLANATSDPVISLTGQGTAFKKSGGGYYTFTILSSSTATASETATGFDWESLVVNLLYALDLVGALAISFSLLHKSSNIKK